MNSHQQRCETRHITPVFSGIEQFVTLVCNEITTQVPVSKYIFAKRKLNKLYF